jgi:hypothetical protein
MKLTNEARKYWPGDRLPGASQSSGRKVAMVTHK